MVRDSSRYGKPSSTTGRLLADADGTIVRDTVLDRVLTHPEVRRIRADVERRIREGELTPTLAAQAILDAAAGS